MPVTPEQLLARLDELNLGYQYYEHPAVFTVAEAQQHCAHITGGHCKNLLLRTKKKQNWLVVLNQLTEVDLKQLAEQVGVGNWSFASKERLWELLGVIPGAVTPLALINDDGRQVNVALQKSLLDYETLNFHPLVNNATVSIRPTDLLTFMRFGGHQPLLIDL